ncbi:MAG: mannose-1-phosphate guanylyltransferase/mannose-6-phosphate isomerase [Chromatiales bacterium]|nr:mannose-1-phosphate guanylyltransferase/mannose-6-phosphate isomerase [Chromatiales bacterium]
MTSTQTDSQPERIDIAPVLLSGGSGTRLWPLSRALFPKQFLAVDGAPHTLLQRTLERLDGLDPAFGLRDALVICNEQHRFLVAEQLRSIGRRSAGIWLEPVGRNTAPAATIAALVAETGDPVLLIMPADHVVADGRAFRAAVETGARLAAAGRLVTFGIVPDAPETGFGYIRVGHSLEGADAFGLAAFVEKPHAAHAQAYVASGEYLWNSGIFMMRASRWLEEIARFRPEIDAACRAAHAAAVIDGDFARVDRTAFAACPSDSIDYAVMEHIAGGDAAVVVPLDAGWSDIGSWSQLWRIGEHDAAGNVKRGDVLVEDAQNNLVIAGHRLVTAVGVEDLVIVETPDAVMVTHRDRAQDVKKLVTRLDANGREEAKLPRCVHRPWGSFESLDHGSRFQVKRLSVKPGAALSLQKHRHRAEHWVVVRGTATVTCDERVFDLHENESTYLPVGAVHRLENRTGQPLDIIEVQSGDYLGEDDIERIEDRYKRNSDD